MTEEKLKQQPQQLTRQQLRELEVKKMTPFQKFLEDVIMAMPVLCGVAAILEYQLIPDGRPNANPAAYLVLLIVMIALYLLAGAVAGEIMAKAWSPVLD